MNTTTAIVSEQQRIEAWLAARRQHVTSTDVPSILQLDDAYGSPIDVFLDKQGLAEKGDAPIWFRRGARMQPVVLAEYADTVGQVIDEIDPYTLFEDPACPLLAASLDGRWSGGDRRCVDAKVVGWLKPGQWGPDFTDEIPQRFAIQLQVQMAVTGTDVADLAVMSGWSPLRVFRVHRDEQLLGFLREAATDFWNAHVLTGVPPAIDHTQTWSKYLATRTPQTTEIVLDSCPEVDRWARGLREVQRRQEQLSELESLAKNALRALIGEHAGLKGAWGRIAYKRGKDKNVLDKDGYIAALEKLVLEPPRKPSAKRPAMLDEIRASFTATKPGDRPLRPTWADEPDADAVDVNQLTTIERPALPAKEEK